MIEPCSDLLECESVLAQALDHVRLIGELPYTPADLEHLGGLIRARIANNLSAGTHFLEHKTPTCLACFLVWAGIEGYEGNTYWPAVSARTGLDDPSWQTRWGRIFLRFLHRNRLPVFDIEGSTAYVTPILGHGGVPGSCLPEYFEKVLAPLVERHLAESEDVEAVRYELQVRREDEAECVRAAAERRRVGEQVRRLQQRIDRVATQLADCRDRQRLRDLDDQIQAMAIPQSLPTDLTAFCNECECRLQDLGGSQQETETRRDDCERVIAGYGEIDRHVVSLAERIRQASERYAEHLLRQEATLTLETEGTDLAERLHDQARAVLAVDWQDGFGAELTALPFSELSDAIEQYRVLSARRAELALALETAERDSTRERMEARRRRLGIARLLCLVLAAIRRRLRRTPAPIHSQNQANQNSALRQDLHRVADELAGRHLTVSSMLAGLPIAGRHLEDPDAQLCEALLALDACYDAWTQVQERRRSLHSLQAQSESELAELCGELGEQGIGASKSILARLEARLQMAEQRRLAAENAASTLVGELQPRLAAIAAERASIERRLLDVQRQLKEIGGGSLEAGSARVAEARALQEEAAALRRDLGGRRAGPSALVDEGAWDLQEAEEEEEEELLTAEANQLCLQMSELLIEARAIEDLCDQTPGVWSAVDEPIRRYLLYGGEAADDFLINSVALYVSYAAGGAIPEVAVDLPERVVAAFDEWHRLRDQGRALGDTAGDSGHSGFPVLGPLIYYDALAQEIMVRVPAQFGFRPDARRFELELVGIGARREQQVIPLRLYRRPDGTTETESREFPLPFPAEQYTLRLKSRDQVAREWSWVGLGDGQYVIFDGTSGRLAPGDELAQRRAYLVAPADFRVEPESCLVEKAPLYGPWHQFAVHTVDPAGLECLILIHGKDPTQSMVIRVALETLPTLEVLGGLSVAVATSDGQPVYALAPEEVRIPIRSAAELRLWHLSLARLCGRPRPTVRLRISELEAEGALRMGNGYASIMLTHPMLLGEGTAGSFVLRLRRPPFRDWQHAFAVLPGLAVHFDQAVYAPYAPDKTPSAQVIIDLGDVNDLTILPPGRLLAREGAQQRLIVSLQEDVGRVVVKLSDGELPLTIALPKTYWRFQGLADLSDLLWRDQIASDEMWLGDWQGLTALFLVVALPASLDGAVVLSLDGDMGRVDRQDLRWGSARFNLLAFRDAVRSGPPLRELRLSLEDPQSAFPTTPILQLRWQWEVVALECVQESKGHEIALTATWQERGRTEGGARLIRLWRAGDHAMKPLAEVTVAEGAYEARLRVDGTQAPPGEYLLQFILEDPWAGTQPQCPERGTTNCHVIVIMREEEIRDGCLLGIRAVRLLPKIHSAPPDPLTDGLYRIRIVGRIINRRLPPVGKAQKVLVTRANEGWYVGNVEVPGGSGLESEAQAANPVKFDYDVTAREITAIEDREGDGAMYCRRCHRLFWSREALEAEQHRKHALVGPVEHFEVDWL